MAPSTAQAGIYNGTGESFIDNNNGKSFGLRVTSTVAWALNLGASYFSHDGVLAPQPPANTPDSSFRNNAFGLDASWGKPGDAGLFVVADYMRGDAFRHGAQTMSGLSLVTAYQFRFATSRTRLYAIEPAVRFDTSDPDSDSEDDASTLLTAVFGLYLNSTTQLRVAYERQNFQGSGPTVAGFRMATTVHF